MSEILEIQETRTLTGSAKIGGETVVSLSAVIKSDMVGSTSYTEIITKQDLYSKNAPKLREAVAQFKDEVYKVEDEFLAINNPVEEPVQTPEEA